MNPSPYPPPRLIFWETTAGCNLACIHCRRITVADQLLPQDLTTSEAFNLVDQVAEFARPIFVLSGGEPLFRPDIFEHRPSRRGRGTDCRAGDQRHAD